MEYGEAADEMFGGGAGAPKDLLMNDAEICVALTERLAKLAEMGICTKSEYNVQNAIDRWGAAHALRGGLLLLLMDIGSRTGADKNGMNEYAYSNDATHLDTDCIKDGNDYVMLMNRLSQMSCGEFAITDISCDLHSNKDKKGRLSFIWHDQTYAYEPIVDENWLDYGLFDWINKILKERSSSDRRFLYLGLAGSSSGSLLIYTNEDTFEQLEYLTLDDPASMYAPDNEEPPDKTKPPRTLVNRVRRQVSLAIAALLLLGIIVFFVMSLLPLLPLLPPAANTAQDRAVAYLDEHLDASVKLLGTSGSYGTNQVFTFEDAQGMRFAVVATFSESPGAQSYPTLTSNYLGVRAGERDGVLAKAFAAWNYNPLHRKLYLSKDDDLSLVSKTLAEQLNALAAPIIDDPSRVFEAPGIAIYYDTGDAANDEPRFLSTFKAPIGESDQLDAATIQSKLEAKLAGR